MIPWMRDQIAEAWHNRKSSRTADKRSLALSSVGTGNATSNDTMLTPLPTSPENFSINVISIEGNVLDVAIKPNFTVENIKKIAVVHFYGQDTTKSISNYRLVHSTKFVQLKDENYVSDEDINEYDELLLVEIRSQEESSDEDLKGPSLEAITQATSDLPSVRNPPKPVPSIECPADFQNEIRKILITLVQASAKILMYSPYAEKLYDDIKEKLEIRCNPINDLKVVKSLVEMGYPHKKVLKALRLRKSNMTEALEWLIEHQDDSDDDSDDEIDFLPVNTMTDTDIANPSSSMNTKKKSFKEACLELFKVVQPPITLFMGIDKFENEDLIKWGWPEDVWFHVDKYSSAHVYLRLRHGQTIDDIPSTVLEDAAQLVKANSIEGNKMNDVDIVYTMWSNLKKTQGMEVGQVGFHKDKDVRKIHVAKRVNTIVNRLNKTKRSEQVNLRNEREQRDKNEREDKKKLMREQKEKEKAEEKRRQEEAEMRSYNSLFNTSNMTSNTETSGYDSDDFM
ncbi:PREDICTED: ubiquitin-associated domain-containing protein 1-like [Atta cephalotes]|uniref:Coiled-coil domain-containing protein 25 n=1 Tax=Atta cephalotes TaxID=12957 RepID=A0A158P377_ATTCE|nr:PREDICTED: ubiquitin-associated domain-containing protein 1-like [Atta cephalotes]